MKQLLTEAYGRGTRRTRAPRTHARAPHAHQLRVLLALHDLHLVQLDVEVLVDRVQLATQLDVVLELDHDLLSLHCLEERVEELRCNS